MSKSSYTVVEYGPLKGGPFYTTYIPCKTPRPILQNPLKKGKDHIKGP